jgi:hypothetical protein
MNRVFRNFKTKTNKMNRIFKSSGMLWNDGDIPECDYCTKDFDNVEVLLETPISGGLVCEDQECRDALLQDILYNEVKEEQDGTRNNH